MSRRQGSRAAQSGPRYTTRNATPRASGVPGPTCGSQVANSGAASAWMGTRRRLRSAPTTTAPTTSATWAASRTRSARGPVPIRCGGAGSVNGACRSCAVEALGGGVGTVAVVGEAVLDFGDCGGEGEQVAGDELVVVVGADGVPVHAFGGDGDFGDEGFGGQDDTGIGEAAQRDGPHDLVLAGDAEVVEQAVEGRLFGVAGFVGGDGGGDADVEPFGEGGADAVEGTLPATRPAVVVVAFGGGRVEADLQGQVLAGHAAQHVQAAAAKEHAVGEQGGG